MAWITALVTLVGHIAWPATLLVLVILFRREIRQRLTAVTEVKYPGGSITMKEVERLEAKVEGVSPAPEARRLSPGSRMPSFVLPHQDTRLAIAQMRLDAEKELFLIARHTVHHGDATGWTAGRSLEELEKSGSLDPSLVDSVREFIAVAAKIVHDVGVEEDVVQRAVAVGGSLVATLRHRRLVLEALRDFDGHGLWQMHRHHSGADKKYYWWSGVAASLPEFDYDYDVYREGAELHNAKVKRDGHNGDDVYVLSLDEFVSVLEFRERELLRIISVWRSGKPWDQSNRDIEWRWPSEWGDIGWNGPILRERVHLWGAEEDLMRTRAALAHYRPLLLAARRSKNDRADHSDAV